MLKGKLSSEVLNERQQYINSLKRFVLEKEDKLKTVLNQLKLTEESLAKVEAKQMCPFDPNHSVPEYAFKKHVEKCRLLHAGYQQDELPSQLQNLDICYEGTKVMKINIDESLLNKVIWDECAQSGQVYTGHRTMPASHIDETVNLTQNDRLAVYNYVVKTTHEAGNVIPVDRTDQLLTTDWGQLVKKGMLNEQSNQQYSSKLEQLAALRDMKRRRQSYRAKNVHVTKKSYTEIIREVIVNQMEILAPEKESSNRNVLEEEKESKSGSGSRERKRKHRDRDDSRERDSYKSGRSRERSRSRKYESRGDKRSREQRSSEKRNRTDVNDNVAPMEKLTDVKREPEDADQQSSRDHYSTDYHRQRERESGSDKRKEPESSRSGDSDGDHHHRKSKHKKSKHKKKHSKKHKKSDK